MIAAGALQGQTALVTGAVSGIGRAVAEAYIAEGAQVVILDKNLSAAERVADQIGAVRGVAANVADEDSVISAVKQSEDLLGSIDILVNSAGILTEVPLIDMSLGTWRETLDVDLTGVFLMCRYVVPGMVDRRHGRVINVASQLGIKGGRSLTHYSAAKAGVIGLTKSLALDVANAGVLVNAIAPGPIETPLIEGLSPEWRRSKQAELPLGRFGLPEEVAPTAVLLASSPGGNLFVGQTLGPNSGDVMP